MLAVVCLLVLHLLCQLVHDLGKLLQKNSICTFARGGMCTQAFQETEIESIYGFSIGFF